MKRILLSMALVFSILGCSKDKESAETPAALQAIISNNNCVCSPYVKEYFWRGQHVFLLAYRGAACNWTPAYYGEEGNVIQMEAGYTLDNFWSEALFIRLVWECSENDG